MKGDKIFRNGKNGRVYIVRDINTVYVISPYVNRKLYVKNSNDFVEKLIERGYREEITK